MAKGKKIRVLVVDDSFFMKRLIKELLETDGGIEVVGVAKNGTEAFFLAKELLPEVITMDYNMPDMTGAEVVKKIVKDSSIDARVVMISAYTSDNADETMESLRAGAIDFVQKPSGELSLDIDTIKDEIIAKVKIAAQAETISFPKIKEFHGDQKQKSKTIADKLVVIGASTGGPPLVESILHEMEKDFDSAMVIVQHMPKFFTGRFADRINKMTPLCVKEMEDGDKLMRGCAFVVPSGFDFEIRGTQKVIKLKKQTDHIVASPSINQAYVEASDVFGDQLLVVQLTGMGEDGVEGAKKVKESGGHIFAQDPETAAVGSMPQSVIEANLSEKTVTPANVAKEIYKKMKNI